MALSNEQLTNLATTPLSYDQGQYLVKQYAATPDQLAKLKIAPQLSPAVTATPPTAPNTTMNAAGISGSTTKPAGVTLPPPPQNTNDYNGVTNSIPTIESIVAPTTPSATETEQTGIISSLKDLYAKMTGKATAQTNAENAAGIPQFNTQLNDINSQIKQLQSDATSATIRSEDRLAPSFAIQGEQTKIEHERAIKALGLNAIASTLQGNIALAQQQADRAVATEFGPIQEQIDYAQKVFDLNKETLTREDAKKALLVQAQLDERQRLLDNQKEDKKTIIGWAAEASKNGASSLLINKALAETDPNTALSILSGFLADPVAKQQALADLTQTRAQTKLTNANIKKLNEKTVETVSGVFKDIVGADGKTHSLLVNPKTGETIKDYGATPLTIEEKKAEDSKIQSAKTQIPVLTDKLSVIKDIQNSPYLNDIVGPNSASRISWTSILTGGKSDLLGKVNQLTSQETLNQLLQIKAAGGTFGALSEKELGILKDSATALNGVALHEDASNPERITGFKASEDYVNAELKKLYDSTNNIKIQMEQLSGTQATGDDTQTVNGVTYKKGPDGLYYPVTK